MPNSLLSLSLHGATKLLILFYFLFSKRRTLPLTLFSLCLLLPLAFFMICGVFNLKSPTVFPFLLLLILVHKCLETMLPFLTLYLSLKARSSWLCLPVGGWSADISSTKTQSNTLLYALLCFFLFRFCFFDYGKLAALRTADQRPAAAGQSRTDWCDPHMT